METFRVFICLLALVPLCYTLCTTVDLVKNKKKPSKGCVDKDGIQHKFGSDWVKDCVECSCTESDLTCCSLFPDGDDLPPECELIVNRPDCTYRVVQKSDNTKECDLN